MSDEKYELVIDMPEITFEIEKGRIICGQTVVDVEKVGGTFELTHNAGYIAASSHRKWPDAERAARYYAARTERIRLIKTTAEGQL